jgi:antitoxin (DNA-binding transcriptional repressor) of toxin-antitoxin stability system
MRSVSEARNAFSALVGDAENGVTTHVVKGSTVVAHIVPTTVPILDDENLRFSFIAALAADEAKWAGVEGWRRGRLEHAGDTAGRLLAWTWRTDYHLCLQAFALFHDQLQKVLGFTVEVSAIWPGIEVALGVSLSRGEVAALFQHLLRHYDEYYHGPFRASE